MIKNFCFTMLRVFSSFDNVKAQLVYNLGEICQYPIDH